MSKLTSTVKEGFPTLAAIFFTVSWFNEENVTLASEWWIRIQLAFRGSGSRWESDSRCKKAYWPQGIVRLKISCFEELVVGST